MRRNSRFYLAFVLASLAAILFATPLAFPARSVAADDKPVWSDQEKPIVEQLRGLRKLPDDVRAHSTMELALQIRQLPVTPNKLRLAGGLASLSTEGDFGHDALQEVANTLAAALREQPHAGKNGEPGSLYMELASLARYEHVQAAVDTPQYAAAMAKLEANDAQRQQADFTLTDLHGKNWTLKDLRGKVVLLNFWATWCPPCRKEMPDLEALYLKFKDKDQGFVVLAISDEDAAKVSPFLAERDITYPVLLDPGRKVNEQFQIEGIPKSFVYDRSGKLVAQSIDMRTQRQFLEMLAQAGLQ
jgi:peroxiredoxin